MRTLSLGRGIWDRVLTVVLALAILGALGTLSYSLANPAIVERFTEFYILGASGEAKNYPAELVAGREAKQLVGIINREQETATYRVEVIIDGVKSNETGPITLEHNEKWEKTVSFTPNRTGNNQKIEFLLYKQGQNNIYESLHLWVNVTE